MKRNWQQLTFQGPFVELVQEIGWQLVLFVAHQLDTADGYRVYVGIPKYMLIASQLGWMLRLRLTGP